MWNSCARSLHTHAIYFPSFWTHPKKFKKKKKLDTLALSHHSLSHVAHGHARSSDDAMMLRGGRGRRGGAIFFAPPRVLAMCFFNVRRRRSKKRKRGNKNLKGFLPIFQQLLSLMFHSLLFQSSIVGVSLEWRSFGFQTLSFAGCVLLGKEWWQFSASSKEKKKFFFFFTRLTVCFFSTAFPLFFQEAHKYLSIMIRGSGGVEWNAPARRRQSKQARCEKRVRLASRRKKLKQKTAERCFTRFCSSRKKGLKPCGHCTRAERDGKVLSLCFESLSQFQSASKEVS